MEGIGQKICLCEGPQLDARHFSGSDEIKVIAISRIKIDSWNALDEASEVHRESNTNGCGQCDYQCD
jgi:hypothetical protein